jgi:hypothetical protein
MATKRRKDLVICQLCSLIWFFEIKCGKQRDALVISDQRHRSFLF